ncbi:hypothetical protein AAFF_G00432280 [Aldrovandia affinis]|uniref:Uncharacterized protein n=1 Tax=Aldrovandia affinis TaxID=143900 RepID=A0AAD7R3J6_9TELE|nr:hypothetical protein AAFF_G00432280 [Aldrovandia affinis]
MADQAASAELLSPLTGSEAAVPGGGGSIAVGGGGGHAHFSGPVDPYGLGGFYPALLTGREGRSRMGEVAIRKRASSGEMHCPRVVKAAPIITVNHFEVLAVPTEGESASSDMDMEVGSLSNFLDSWDTIEEGKMTAQIVVVIETRLITVREQKRREEVRGEKKQELHLKLPLLNVISVQAHTRGSDR